MKKVRWYLIFNNKVVNRYDNWTEMYSKYRSILKSLSLQEIPLLDFKPEIYEE